MGDDPRDLTGRPVDPLKPGSPIKNTNYDVVTDKPSEAIGFSIDLNGVVFSTTLSKQDETRIFSIINKYGHINKVCEISLFDR